MVGWVGCITSVLPTIFGVTRFHRREDGAFAWPGFGEHIGVGNGPDRPEGPPKTSIPPGGRPNLTTSAHGSPGSEQTTRRAGSGMNGWRSHVDCAREWLCMQTALRRLT